MKYLAWVGGVILLLPLLSIFYWGFPISLFMIPAILFMFITLLFIILAVDNG